MTSFGTGASRFYSSLEEAQQHKPADKPSWDVCWFDVVDNRADSPTKGQTLRVYGATGGTAVLGWQIASYFNACTGGKADKQPRNDAALAAAKQENDELKRRLAALEAQLVNNAPQPQPEPQPNSEPQPEPTGKRGKKS